MTSIYETFYETNKGEKVNIKTFETFEEANEDVLARVRKLKTRNVAQDITSTKIVEKTGRYIREIQHFFKAKTEEEIADIAETLEAVEIEGYWYYVHSACLENDEDEENFQPYIRVFFIDDDYPVYEEHTVKSLANRVDVGFYVCKNI